MILRKEMSKLEIEKALNGQGDYVQIDNLTRFLKENLPMDMKKFLYARLIEVYQRRNMFADAAEICNRLIEISMTPADRITCSVKEVEFLIKAGFFDKADLVMRRIVGDSNAREGQRIESLVKGYYQNQAQIYEKEKRRNNAIKTYEKILTLNISNLERGDVEKKLLELYKELGIMDKFMVLRKKFEK
ncbi:hypothetical protein M0R19_02335 [Candidatus Pacearchaeota archaeon]|nr:hypothetical protein [Candidatus Pacearchaeota archaeon]